MPRIKGKKYGTYNVKYDQTGRVEKENTALRAFWSKHKLKDMISLSEQELDSAIDKFLEEYQERALKRNPGWWYPSLGSLNDLRYTKETRKKRNLLTKKEEQ